MVQVRVFVGEADELLGDFDFEVVPRAGEDLYVPAADDPHGLRIFQVGEVNHIAEGLSETQFGAGAKIVLRYCTEYE